MWTTLTIAGRSTEVFTPVERPRFVLIFLPDIGGTTLRDNDSWGHWLEQQAMACVVPDGGDAWWLDTVYPPFHASLTPECYLLDEVMPWIADHIGQQPIGLVGVGMGGQGALRIGFRHPTRFKAVGGLASLLDFHEAYGSGSSLDELFTSREHCRLATPILQIHAHVPPLWFACDPNSVWHRGHERLASKLTALGAPYTADLETTTCGHSWNYYDHMAPRLLRFISETLTQEARRLL